ncbi:uncharacterized protein K441DRAFT_148816 [Cenococcum geophilum 1.58]|uniref:uncharacterized protein n=1 Tax=Cenococcum geophilum 1.58 TaxID=794803 RepID=UPI00358F30B9|nr:hypothetical protein K441DRAFT_148816 [Cenococcum geophilum 1.58]
MSKHSDTASSIDNMSTVSDTASSELTAVVDELLGQLSTKFSSISSELITKMDDMSRRLDNLEATIQAGESSKGESSGK